MQWAQNNRQQKLLEEARRLFESLEKVKILRTQTASQYFIQCAADMSNGVE